MKVTSATIRLVLKRSKVNKNGESPIHLVICYHGRVEKSTGISVKPKDWDEKREQVKKSAGNAPVLNKMLNDFKNEIIQRRADFEVQGRQYTTHMLLEASTANKDYSDGTFWAVCERLIEERRLRDGSIRGYLYTYRKLSEFLKRKHFYIDELTLGIVKDFATWMEKDGIKINTIKHLLSKTAAVWNYAIQRKIVTGENYPFTQFKYTQKYHEIARDYYLTENHIIRLRNYWLDLCIERNGKLWHYRDGVEKKLMNRCSAEFGILWFLMCYKMNGSAPIELAMLTPDKCKRSVINGEDYWSIDIRRRKTGREVHIRLKRDLFVIAGFEFYMGFSGRYVYPILHWHEGCSDAFLNSQSHKTSDKAIAHVRKAFELINLDIAKDNVRKGLTEPLVDLSQLVFYTERHSFAQHYLNRPGATVNGLASLMARSHNTIATYLKQLTRDEEIAEMVDDMPI